MKKLIPIIIVITVIITVHYFTGILSSQSILTAKMDISNNSPAIILEEEELFELKSQIAASYGFKTEKPAMLSTPFGRKLYNRFMYDHLNKTLGKNWQAGYQEKVDAALLTTKSEQIKTLLFSLPQVHDFSIFLKKISSGDRHLDINILSKPEKGANVQVVEKAYDGSLLVYSSYFVDPYNLNIKLIEN